MLISLSFRITITRFFRCPPWFSASKAMPADIEPSPITATASPVSPPISRAAAKPTAAEIEVEEWPAPKQS